MYVTWTGLISSSGSVILQTKEHYTALKTHPHLSWKHTFVSGSWGSVDGLAHLDPLPLIIWATSPIPIPIFFIIPINSLINLLLFHIQLLVIPIWTDGIKNFKHRSLQCRSNTKFETRRVLYRRGWSCLSFDFFGFGLRHDCYEARSAETQHIVENLEFLSIFKCSFTSSAMKIRSTWSLDIQGDVWVYFICTERKAKTKDSAIWITSTGLSEFPLWWKSMQLSSFLQKAVSTRYETFIGIRSGPDHPPAFVAHLQVQLHYCLYMILGLLSQFMWPPIRELTSLRRCSNTYLRRFIAFIAFYGLVVFLIGSLTAVS